MKLTTVMETDSGFEVSVQRSIETERLILLISGPPLLRVPLTVGEGDALINMLRENIEELYEECGWNECV